MRVVAFDKTGTVTTGTLHARRRASGRRRDSADDVLALAASVESQSEHPIAAAIVRGRAQAAASRSSAPAMCGAARAGRRGTRRRRRRRVRHAAAVRRARLLTPAASPLGRRSSQRGMSPVLVARDGVAIGVLGVTDRPEGGAAASSSDLRAQGMSRVAMITGDHDAAARADRRAARRRRRALGAAAAGQGRGRREPSRTRTAPSRWSATASTTRRRWPPPTSAS